ncbi:DUF4003 family protein [Nannocystis sp. SCPEA4]|uniref:DUF4003 family protein n=1 Tax=Nannocystis sp. SCPEA4 TaxID=2996787 RepID=UPI00226E59EA|nr:DUF4003 family protein [Nannocystis sp. SCPEA4]MCY1060344.1 DUF4003 family protein [Nannocystis sp. SCPEA4]
MPFRSIDGEPGFTVPADPLARFDELLTALDAGRGWMQDKVAIRLAAITLLVTPGDAKRIAASTRTASAVLGERLGWFSGVDESVRLVIAAQLVKADDYADAFVDELERVRGMFRADGLRRGGVYEVLAVLVLRRLFGTIEPEHVERLHNIYDAMKAHHWWLTGPEDFPACAMLSARPEEPAAIGTGTDAIYKALHEQAGLSRGDPLQTAAHILYLGGVEAPVIVERFSGLLTAFRAAGAKIGTSEYDEVAILSFVALPAATIVATVRELEAGLRARLKWLGERDALSLGASLAFVRLVGASGELGALADAKLLLDMQTIVTARQTASIAAISAAST